MIENCNTGNNWIPENQEMWRVELLVEEMKSIARQIQDWTELVSCRCSQHTLKETMFYADKWEIGEKFRWVLNWSEYAIASLAKYLINQELQHKKMN